MARSDHAQAEAVRPNLLYDPRVLKLLTFLTRSRTWLSPPEIAKRFQIDGRPVSLMTIYRWFEALEDTAGLSYFPYPRMNLLGLQEVVVSLRGVRNPAVLSTIPFSHSFLAEIGLGDGQPFVTQGYWVPHQGMQGFREYWSAAKDLGLVREADLLAVRNTHFLYSPFEEVVGREGRLEISDPVDNTYFEALLRRHLQDPFETKFGEAYAAAPFLVPLVLEHLWGHYSSRDIWRHLRAKGGDDVRRFGKGKRGSALTKPGAGERVLHEGWRELLKDFGKVFLQPVVFLPPGAFPNSTLLSIQVKAGSPERMVELAMRISELSLMTAVQPEVGVGARARIWCVTAPPHQAAVLRAVRDTHQGPEPPSFSLIDAEATRQAVQPGFCRFDWRLFDPATLAWKFEPESYVEALKG